MAAPPPDCVPCSLRLTACRNRLKRNFAETVIENLDFALFPEPATDSRHRTATIRRNRPSYAGADKSVHAKSSPKRCSSSPRWLVAPSGDPLASRGVADMQDVNRIISEPIENPIGIARNDLDEDRRPTRALAAERVGCNGFNRLAQAGRDISLAPPGERFVRVSTILAGSFSARGANDHSPARFHNSMIRLSSTKSPRAACASPSIAAASSDADIS
jgi:hypothetical protein